MSEFFMKISTVQAMDVCENDKEFFNFALICLTNLGEK